MVVPTVTLNELSEGIDKASNDTVKKVLIGMMNDYMDLLYGNTSDYTTGKRVLPMDTTIADVDAAAADSATDKKFIDVFKKISETHKSGDLTPQSKNGDNGSTWDSKLHPVLVVVKPNP
ncbi:hypothetical protein O0L34_g7550 [Tuta absoluta]|nr:hypothetical protein O0L34_g7550 [Tuta absoluta]